MNPLPGLSVLPEYQSAAIAIRPDSILVNRVSYPRISSVLSIINRPPSPNALLLRQLSAEIAQAVLEPTHIDDDASPPTKSQVIAHRLLNSRCRLLAAAVPLWRPDWQAAALAIAISQSPQSQLVLWTLADPEDHPFRANMAVAAQQAMLEAMTGLPVKSARLHCLGDEPPTAHWVSPPAAATAAFVAALRLYHSFPDPVH